MRAVDLLPGTPSVVRSALIFVKSTASSSAEPAPEQVLARWVPGHDPEPMDAGTALRASRRRRSRRAHSLQEDVAVRGQGSLRSEHDRHLLLHRQGRARAADAPDRRPRRSRAADTSKRVVTFSRTLDEDVQAVAVSPDMVPPNITLQVEAVLPNGTRTPMIRLLTRADWDRRYWFEQPLTLPRGTRIEVKADLDDPDIMSRRLAAPRRPKWQRRSPASGSPSTSCLPRPGRPRHRRAGSPPRRAGMLRVQSS